MENEIELENMFFSTMIKHIALPVYNTGVEDVYLSKDETLFHINKLECVYLAPSEILGSENKAVDCDTSDVKQNVGNFDHVSASMQRRTAQILDKYGMRLKEPLKVSLAEHEINL